MVQPKNLAKSYNVCFFPPRLYLSLPVRVWTGGFPDIPGPVPLSITCGSDFSLPSSHPPPSLSPTEDPPGGSRHPTADLVPDLMELRLSGRVSGELRGCLGSRGALSSPPELVWGGQGSPESGVSARLTKLGQGVYLQRQGRWPSFLKNETFRAGL